MKFVRRLLTRLLNSITRRSQESRLREEIEEHIAQLTCENARSGISPIEAWRQAMLKFGGGEAMKEDYRAERGLALDRELAPRLALRMAHAKRPRF